MLSFSRIMVIPLFVGRPRSIKALETAMEMGKTIMLAAQKAAAKDEPTASDIYEIGCVANILQMLKLPDGTVKVLVEECAARAHSEHFRPGNAFHGGFDSDRIDRSNRNRKRKRCGVRSCIMFDQYVKLNKKIPPEILTSLTGIDDAGRLADTVAAHLPLKLEQKQVTPGIVFPCPSALNTCSGQLEGELDILQVEKTDSSAGSSARWKSRSASIT